MITVTQLRGFERTRWDAIADHARARSRQATQSQLAVEAQARATRRNWSDANGRMAAARLDKAAQGYEELATSYQDAATIIDSGTYIVALCQTNLAYATTAAQIIATVDGPDDQGYCRPNNLAVGGTIGKAVAWISAQKLTIDIRENLVQATNADRQTALSLTAINHTADQTPDDGPLDLSDSGIQYTADMNRQDRYGDCVTLAVLVSLAHSNPGFIRKHLKWNPTTGTYAVTIYDKQGKPVVVHVDPRTLPVEGSQSQGTNKPTWLSVYEAALQQHYGDIREGQSLAEPTRRITGEGGTKETLTAQQIAAALSQNPPAVMTAATTGGIPQLPGIDPSLRLVPNHAYIVRGVDAEGKIIVQNPWGPSGGYYHDRWYPGEVRLTEAQYRLWLGQTNTRNPPF